MQEKWNYSIRITESIKCFIKILIKHTWLFSIKRTTVSHKMKTPDLPEPLLQCTSSFGSVLREANSFSELRKDLTSFKKSAREKQWMTEVNRMDREDEKIISDIIYCLRN